MNTDLAVLVSNSFGLTHISSRTVADLFRREHKNVLRQIESLQEDESLLSSHCELSEYKDPTGRTLPMHLLTEAGFTVLVSTFRLSSEEDKEMRRNIIRQFGENQVQLLKQNKQLKKRNEDLEANEKKVIGEGYSRRKTPIYGFVVTYVEGDNGEEYPQYERVLKEEYSRLELLQGERFRNKTIIGGLESKNEKITKEINQIILDGND